MPRRPRRGRLENITDLAETASLPVEPMPIEGAALTAADMNRHTARLSRGYGRSAMMRNSYQYLRFDTAATPSLAAIATDTTHGEPLQPHQVWREFQPRIVREDPARAERIDAANLARGRPTTCLECIGEDTTRMRGRCAGCRDSFCVDDLAAYNGNNWCTDCRPRCGPCGGDLDGNGNCHRCLTRTVEGVNDHNIICSHGFEPMEWNKCIAEVEEKNTKSRPVLYGLELEVEANHADKKLKAAIDKDGGGNPPNGSPLYKMTNPLFKNFHIWKRDGSLNRYGYELVLFPHSYQALRPKVKPLLDSLRGAGFTGHATGRCGLHIHINRETFSDKELTRFANFFARCQDQILLLSMRRKSSLERWARFPEATSINYKLLSRQSGDRKYAAINMCHSATVEIRVFRGTTSHRRLLASLQFLDALIHYVKLCGSTHFMNLKNPERDSWGYFMRWANKDGRYREFVHYYEWLHRRGKALHALSKSSMPEEKIPARRARIDKLKGRPKATRPMHSQGGRSRITLSEPNHLWEALLSNDR